MKIVSCLNLINKNLSERCAKVRAPYISAFSKLPKRKIKIKTPPTVDCFLRADKVMNVPYYNKSIQQQMAIDIYKEAINPQKHFSSVLKHYLSRLIATENNPDLPIKTIKSRVKKPENIVEKLQSICANNPQLETKLTTKKGIIEETGDIIGSRIILRNDIKEDTNKILKALLKAHKNGEFKIIEAEVYSPFIEEMSSDFIKFIEHQLGKNTTLDDFYKIISDKDYFSYVTENDIKAFAKSCGIAKPKIKNLPTGYTAIHLGLLLPEGYKAELQIMGCNVEALKEIEDIYYKAKCGKHIPPELVERFKPIMPSTSQKEIQKIMAEYTRNAYLRERLKADKRFNQRLNTEFLVAPDEILNLGLGFNQTAPSIRKAKKCA